LEQAATLSPTLGATGHHRLVVLTTPVPERVAHPRCTAELVSNGEFVELSSSLKADPTKNRSCPFWNLERLIINFSVPYGPEVRVG
jgi:hypothetical protein